MDYNVHCDRETSEHAGAGGAFQVATLEDENGNDVVNIIDQGKHYFSMDELADDIAVATNSARDSITLTEV